MEERKSEAKIRLVMIKWVGLLMIDRRKKMVSKN